MNYLLINTYIIKQSKQIKNKFMKDVKKLLNRGIVEFEFEKLDGTIREVRATRWLHPDIVGEDFKIPDTSDAHPAVIKFVDLDKMAWRSCRVDSILSINKVITEEELFGKTIEF